ncbi:metallophosphoesterase family protein [Sphingopyxis chilensis]|uniref:serine/threonine protein phosphatase n=1 Tax=Sphingopyxis chilensis TaxID=180400 RepID=UPI002DDCF7E2|nr:serine/threonine protein phosphatase [Sphingopyxis chilensis]
MSIKHIVLTLLAVLGASQAAAQAEDGKFTIAVVPDTQYYTDYRHQTEEGFPFDARELFFDQMQYIAANAESEGGDIAFATALGDVWQHASQRMTPEYAAKGHKHVDSFITNLPQIYPDQRVLTVEMPTARKGYEMISGKLPFSVVPGNHDYDSNWSDSRYPEGKDGFPYGMLAYGGLKNWNSVFGADTPFFKKKPWYVDSFNGGANSAQVFEAGGFRFLHIGFEMAPSDEVLKWAEGVIKRYPGVPTIVSTHSYLNPAAERKEIAAVDFKAVDPVHNNPQDVWDKFLSQNDQIFLMLSAHQYGQSRRVDLNKFGHKVYQVMSDYQGRRQSFVTAAPARAAERETIGDGWMRLMKFDLSGEQASVRVSTISTYYKTTASKLPTYSAFYKEKEKPTATDEEFVASDEFTIDLDDFYSRFASARVKGKGKRK